MLVSVKMKRMTRERLISVVTDVEKKVTWQKAVKALKKHATHAENLVIKLVIVKWRKPKKNVSNVARRVILLVSVPNQKNKYLQKFILVGVVRNVPMCFTGIMYFESLLSMDMMESVH